LKQFPRIIHPHRFDDVSRRYLVHPGVLSCLHELMQCDVLAANCMFYYKPPGSRGQAMHQDNFYLLVEPQTCVAAWTAIDDADPENGGMYLVGDTAEEEISCPEEANSSESYTTHFVPTPKGKKALPCRMKAGDTLFFNGSSIHGSGPNRSKDRFRRSFICHYVPKSTQRISKHYLPLLSPEGEEVMIESNASGGPCGSSWQGGTH
jgi:ectoine hydroxylase-related dioxygenase (phytanoyl-CoA dioxygenase family)